MSAARSPRERAPVLSEMAGGHQHISRLRSRRREARRARGLLRLDVLIGVLSAIVLVIVTPGLAIAALIALAALALCGVSIVLERRRRPRPRRRGRRR